MQITIEDISPVEKRVDFEVPWGDVAPRLERAYDKLRREVHLKGFRPGKAPRSVLEKLYKDQVEGDVAREIVESSLGQAITERQIQPVAPPNIDKLELAAGQPLKFTARVEVRSPVTPKDYSGVNVKRRPVKVKDEEVQQILENYKRQLTQYKPIEGRDKTATSDVLVAEFSGRIGEHKIKKNVVTLDLADDNAGGVPGIAERLRGVALDAQNLEVKYTIPAEPAGELAGKEVSLKVSIKEARERKEPAYDDEFAKDTGEADTLDALKTKIRERLEENDKARIKQEMGQEAIKELVKANPIPVGPALVDRHAEAIANRLRRQFAMAGVDVENGGFDPRRMKRELKDEAEREARATILLQAIAEREALEVTDGDLQKRIAELAAARQESAKKLRADLERQGAIEGVRRQMLEEKALDWVLTQAKIVDADPSEQTEEERLIVTPAEAAAEERK